MKHLKFLVILITLFSTAPCYAMAAGFIMQEEVIGDRTERGRLNYASTGQIYTSGVGGVTFSYPTSWFTQAPMVQISLEQNTPHAPTLTYTAEVTASTVDFTTIMVYQISAGIVSEAPTGSVIVCLFAIDNAP